MDKRRGEDVVTDAVVEVGDAAKGKLDQGKGVFEGLQASAGEAEGKATALVREVSTAGSQAGRAGRGCCSGCRSRSGKPSRSSGGNGLSARRSGRRVSEPVCGATADCSAHRRRSRVWARLPHRGRSFLT